MAEDVDALPKGAGMWGQVVAGLLVVPALGFGLWAMGEAVGDTGGGPPRPAACGDGETGGTPGKTRETRGRLSGDELCKALNRPDLARLLGTPEEMATSADGSDGSLKLAGAARDIATPTSEVRFATYTVTLSALYDGAPVAGYTPFTGHSAEERKVLGRPAVLYSDQTISIRFRLDGSDAETGPGVPARSVIVARDARDSGGSYEVTLWRGDGAVPDDAVLLRVAEAVLPTLPGWTPGSAVRP
ncbi:DUF6215 domain-containing protein [Streptomyces sp. Je 1-79]|uniref:DUF6215 domain-containing protein n=1 Tax=Streptomyces sp. Je 1-79 TaxID=2943847 RepID=UPI0021A54A18|nr:DUF6215 domain-containing protein [Streptomyces sp. Je 1-79]MCT4353974.1 DUF6215 domain-containing protein [Streptomyces sp. Je 1-79]